MTNIEKMFWKKHKQREILIVGSNNIIKVLGVLVALLFIVEVSS